MKISLTGFYGVTILIPESERLDAHNADTLKDALKNAFEGGAKNILVDMGKVRFIDSSGLGVLVSGFKNSVAHKGRMALSGLQEQVRSMFELTRLHRVFDIYEERDQALAALREP